MNTYELIREIRNTRLGEPKLEFGCEIITECEINVLGHPNTHFTYAGGTEGREMACYEPFLTVVPLTCSFKNLGKPVSLNEILRLLNENFSVFYNTPEKITLRIVRSSDETLNININVDLTKEIKDQDCLKEIYELIK